jgi:hypothetical protein
VSHVLYGASLISPRVRATKAEMQARYDALIAIAREVNPCTVRQVFYQASVRGIVEKTEDGYNKVQNALVKLRLSDEIPFDWIVDNTRWRRKPESYDGLEEALEDTADFYRRKLWSDADAYVEVWLEKDALAGAIYPVTSQYDVPLMTARGYSSITFLKSSACRSAPRPPERSTVSRLMSAVAYTRENAQVDRSLLRPRQREASVDVALGWPSQSAIAASRGEIIDCPGSIGDRVRWRDQ